MSIHSFLRATKAIFSMLKFSHNKTWEKVEELECVNCMRRSISIIAINKDPNSPVFSLAVYAIVIKVVP